MSQKDKGAVEALVEKIPGTEHMVEMSVCCHDKHRFKAVGRDEFFNQPKIPSGVNDSAFSAILQNVAIGAKHSYRDSINFYHSQTRFIRKARTLPSCCELPCSGCS